MYFQSIPKFQPISLYITNRFSNTSVTRIYAWYKGLKTIIANLFSTQRTHGFVCGAHSDAVQFWTGIMFPFRTTMIIYADQRWNLIKDTKAYKFADLFNFVTREVNRMCNPNRNYGRDKSARYSTACRLHSETQTIFPPGLSNSSHYCEFQAADCGCNLCKSLFWLFRWREFG